MTNEVVVRNDSIRSLVPFEPMDYDAAVLAALGERAKARRTMSRRQVTETTSGDVRIVSSPSAERTVGTAKRLLRSGCGCDKPTRRRRRLAAAVALTGTGLLGASLSTKPASREFYALTFSVAGTWLVGGLAIEPLRWSSLAGRTSALSDVWWRCRFSPVPLRSAPSSALPLVARRIPVLNEALVSVLNYAERGSDSWVLATTLANGVAEEVFFRGSLFTALGSPHPVAASTAVVHAHDLCHPQSSPGLCGRGHGNRVRSATSRLGRPSGADPDACDVVGTHAPLPPRLFRAPATKPVPVAGLGGDDVRLSALDS